MDLYERLLELPYARTTCMGLDSVGRVAWAGSRRGWLFVELDEEEDAAYLTSIDRASRESARNTLAPADSDPAAVAWAFEAAAWLLARRQAAKRRPPDVVRGAARADWLSDATRVQIDRAEGTGAQIDLARMPSGLTLARVAGDAPWTPAQQAAVALFRLPHRDGRIDTLTLWKEPPCATSTTPSTSTTTTPATR